MSKQELFSHLNSLQRKCVENLIDQSYLKGYTDCELEERRKTYYECY